MAKLERHFYKRVQTFEVQRWYGVVQYKYQMIAS